MTFKFKALAVAVAMVAASAAHADLANNSSGNSSVALVAFNQTTGSYYVRDLGVTLNAFLPNSVTTTAIDGGGTAVSGNKTPEAGLNLTWAAGTFTSWLADQTSGTIAWTVAAGDGLTAAGTSNLSRALVATSVTPTGITNNAVRQAVSTSSGVSGLATQNNDTTTWYDKTGSTVIGTFLTNNGFGTNTLNTLNSAASLLYYSTTTGTGSSTVAANVSTFSNSLNTATLTLASSGVLTYDLQPAGPVSAVPLPASVWLMGAGLAGIGGFIRRRKAAAANA